jgi:prepilin-type N-terminal cleavage/methylation domain-containing protein
MKINKPSAHRHAVASREGGFTLIELLVVIAIIAILASIALPVFSSVQERGKQTKDLSNGKQIALALRQFAQDNNGTFPNKKYVFGSAYTDPALVTLAAGDGSNDAFRWLLPTYTTSEDIFVVGGSAWCPNGADNIIDTAAAGQTLKSGECGYSYITALNDTDNPQFPLLADGWDTANITHYNTTKSNKGGVWGGSKAIVIFIDGSGRVMTCDDKTTIAGFPTIWRPGRSGTQDLFDNTNGGAPADPWLAPANLRLNPL